MGYLKEEHFLCFSCRNVTYSDSTLSRVYEELATTLSTLQCSCLTCPFLRLDHSQALIQHYEEQATRPYIHADAAKVSAWRMGIGVEPHASANILASQTPGQLTFVQLEGQLPTAQVADHRRVLRHFSYFTGMSRGLNCACALSGTFNHAPHVVTLLAAWLRKVKQQHMFKRCSSPRTKRTIVL